MSRFSPTRVLRPLLTGHPKLRRALRRADTAVSRWQHSLAQRFPAIIRPQPRQLTVAVTAACNLRCMGCRYGRDFMVGDRLSLAVMKQVLGDAKDVGIDRVRLYGGEPLLHPDLPAIVRCSTGLGLDTYVTTNGVLLQQRFDELHAAGLRCLTMGFYGIAEEYDAYTQRHGHFARLEESLTYVRQRYGDTVEMQLNFVLLRPMCNSKTLHEAWRLAQRFNMFFHLDLWGYSIPFFTNGPDHHLAFRSEDRAAVAQVAAELEQLKQAHPHRFPQSVTFIRSIPDWLLKGPNMRIPCDAHQLVWVGADGTVQLCDVTFKLGNVNDTRLKDLLFNRQHRQACRDAFQLNCPNCTCKVDSRIEKHAPSVRQYGTR
jgi:cyclic pyranopterin phosphate synthase